jgi:SAM-dependent methyltransferase
MTIRTNVAFEKSSERGRPVTDDVGWVCPACRFALRDRSDSWECLGCGRFFPVVGGLPDFRLASDRYLTLEGDRTKAMKLIELERRTRMIDLAACYYAMTDDVDASRRARFLEHIAHAEPRGSALAALLPLGARVLEVGCGSGGFVAAAARKGLTIQGVDIAMRWLVIARRRMSDEGRRVSLLGGNAERLPYADASFEVVVADSLLEHLESPLLALREWARVLTPGGRLIVWSPNRFSLATDPHMGLLGVGWMPRRLARHYVRRRRGCGWVVRPLSAGDARRLASAAGFRRVGVEAPAIGKEWAGGRQGAVPFLIRAYGRARQFPGTRGLLKAFGPLWQLTAIKDEHA